MQREQSLPARLASLNEEVLQAETHLAELRQRQAEQLTALQDRELQIEVRLAAITSREEVLLQSQKSQEGRERELRNLRSELDIREEALSQQYAQLQLDRSTLRSAQSRLQLAEQAIQQREVQVAKAETVLQVEDPTLVAREQAVAEQARELEGLLTDLNTREEQLAQRSTDLEIKESGLQENLRQLQTQQSQLERDRLALEGLRQEYESQHQALLAAPVVTAETQASHEELTRQLQSLVEEREALSQLRAELVQEQQGLRAERDELRKIRQQFDQEREQFLGLKEEAQTERDTFLLERQEIITERQALRDRERQVLAKEAEAARHQAEIQQAREEFGISQTRLEEERVHLNEEWDALRQERAELADTQASLDAQREELSELAQQLAELQAGVDGLVNEHHELESSPPAANEDPVESDFDGSPAAEATEETEEVVEEQLADADADAGEDSTDEPEPEPDALAGFASFSSIGHAEEEGIPPEVAEIIRKTAGQHAPPPPPPVPVAAPKSVTGRLDAMLGMGKPVSAESEQDEKRRLQELLSKSTDDYVDAATHGIPEEAAADEYDQYASDVEDPVNETEESEQLVTNDPVEVAKAPVPGPSDDIRSKLSAMFGIDLGGRKAAPSPVAEPLEEEVYEEEAAYDEPVDEEVVEEPAEPESTDAETADNSTEHLDPVAAYMEQLLARTRTGKTEAPPAPAPKKPVEPAVVVAPPVVPVKVEKIAEPEPEPEEVQRAPRKLDAAEKEAMRANMDSFRTIANSQARSDVARSELRRLKVTVKVKRVFVGVSAVIGLVLLSTFFWADKNYYLEILAAIIATAFLSVDFVRTEKRLRELAASMPEDDEPAVF